MNKTEVKHNDLKKPAVRHTCCPKITTDTSVRHAKAKQHKTAHLYIPVVLLQQLCASVNVINTCQLLQQSPINK